MSELKVSFTDIFVSYDVQGLLQYEKDTKEFISCLGNENKLEKSLRICQKKVETKL